MFTELTDWLLSAIHTHGILAVVLGVVIETVIVPIPSPLILMAAGSILIPSGPIYMILLNALWISLIAGLAQTIGSYILFFIGYYGGKPIIEKYERFHGVSWKEIQSFQKKFSKKRKEEYTLFLLRALPIMPLSVVSGVAGILEIDKKKYTIATFLGTIPRNLILSLMGYYMKGGYDIIAGHFDNAETILTILVILLILGYILGHKTGLFDKIRKKLL